MPSEDSKPATTTTAYAAAYQPLTEDLERAEQAKMMEDALTNANLALAQAKIPVPKSPPGPLTRFLQERAKVSQPSYERGDP